MKNKLPAVIVRAERQRQLVDNLLSYCHNLDGESITVIDAPPDRGPSKEYYATDALHLAAATFKGGPFFWLEPDSIPLTPGWLDKLSKEYYDSGKDFMLSSDSHPPDDEVGGIGVYGPTTHWLLPKIFRKAGWDLWMLQNIKPLIHFTPLIQHKYGHYFNHKAFPLRFPKDQHLIRPDALLFHADKFQDLLPSTAPVADPAREEVVFKHNGDIGDVIAALPILREIGGGKILLYHDPHAPAGKRPRQSLEGARFGAIKPLLEVQPYVTKVEWGNTIPTNHFREVLRPINESLIERQARHCGKWPIDLSPWLSVPSYEKHNRVVIARSLRYHGIYPFPWKEAYETYGDRLLFIGLPDEHAAFETLIGHTIEHAKTENFLQIAQIMAGAPQVIANQSSPLWVALGLGCKIICEGHPQVPNSQIPRPGSFWSYTQADADAVKRAFAAVRAKK